MQFEDLLYEVAGGRATITINRPERLNAFRVQTVEELAIAFEAAADDETVGVIVITGAGDKAFASAETFKIPRARRPKSATCTICTTALPLAFATTANRSSPG